MISIHHVLKDGTKVESVEGHVIKAEEFSVLYEVISRIQKEEGDQKKDEAV